MKYRIQMMVVIAGAAVVLAIAPGMVGCANSDAADEKNLTEKETPVAKSVKPVPEPTSPQVPGKPLPAKPIVIMETSKGAIKIELWPDKAPLSVANFLQYVDEKFYDGTIFHRVIGNFVIQGGGRTADLQKKPTRKPIKNEARTDVKNLRATLSMARTPEVNSATSQFFISVVDNPTLDHRNNTPHGFGYAVFGKVIEGMEVVDAIRRVPTKTVTTARGPLHDVPAEPVVIKSARREK